jgi:hypothetical protein
MLMLVSSVDQTAIARPHYDAHFNLYGVLGEIWDGVCCCPPELGVALMQIKYERQLRSRYDEVYNDRIILKRTGNFPGRGTQ